LNFLGETFFKEKGFPEPFPKTFSIWEKKKMTAYFL